MAQKKLALGVYANELRSEVTAFVRYWREMMKKEPEQFEKELEPGQWDEQFRAWQESQ